MPVTVQYSELLQRDVPKINGSSGAFIAVVVVLAIIIVVSCSAVVYLYYDSRQRDPPLRQRYQAAVTASNRGMESPGNPSPGKLRAALDRVFSRNPTKSAALVDSPNPGRRSGQGWVQAAGNDYEDSADDQKRPMGHAPQMSEVLDRPGSTVATANTVLSQDPRARVSSMLSDTSMSMHSSFRDGTALRYPEPYAPSPKRSISTMTAHLLPNSMVSSPASTPPPSVSCLSTASPDTSNSTKDHGGNDPNASVSPGRTFTSQSGASMRTIDTGSKFIEGL